ncbi:MULTISPECIES: hypothetical protein [Xanthomonas]|uniref:hypothetical protein n=1 Tax=Xanthomonas TaxID=338 RepID=UPI001E423DA3|nr:MULTISPECIES: hypothetical protein [Xanthomonas]MDM4802166.1 hypothetical protein [Xanthomonas phaseoli pv. phaseoli]MDM4810306.1 hypothetical protein [Xanthomonas phaseoli pv. phaseoli]UEQ17452.1 hypothetical protein K9838_10190 [Xanthomonas phaseoli pv. manihotis]UZB22859.1 hypothetical protein OM947_10630 [Xanthomonas phaseoli pv. phaseoli]UZB27181.1 hypothetical protein OM954_10595 [Xanthomonas phaseoli pv. phaseoli]
MQGRHVQGLLRIAGFAHDIDASEGLQQPGQAGTDKGVIVDDDDSHGAEETFFSKGHLS